MSLSVSPIVNTAGKVVGAAAIARDISSRKQAEEALRKAEKLSATGRLAAAIAHEINNPLESLTNLVYLLQLNESLDNSARQLSASCTGGTPAGGACHETDARFSPALLERRQS